MPKIFFRLQKKISRITLQTLWLIILFLNSAYASPNLEGIQVYKDLQLSKQEHQQIINEDIDRYRNADNLWDVLRYQFSLEHYEDNPLVQDQIEFFMNHQEFLQHCALHAAPYLYYILQQAKKYNLPAEFVLLPMIESSYNPYALSPAGAAGIWQMMPETANGYGVKQTRWYDGRRDLIASTKAAIQHIIYLNTFFNGNWLLAIAAYDTGEGNVLAAIRRNIRDGRPTDYWSLPLAQETRTYTPRLLALATIIAHPEKFPIYLPPIRNAPYLAQVDVNVHLDLQKAADFAGMPLKNILHLNPAYKRLNTPHGPYKLLLPIENVTAFTENLAQLPSSQHVKWQEEDPSYSSYEPQEKFLAVAHEETPVIPVGNYQLQPGDTIYMSREGDTLKNISKRFHISISNLRIVNNLNNSRLKVGTKIIIPTHTETLIGDNEKKYSIAPGDTVYMVRQGDTLESIATKFHTTLPLIRIANMLASNNVREGDRILIPTHL